jgi:hypothetical protein
LFFGKLSKALIEGKKKKTPTGPPFSFFLLLQWLLFSALFNITTHTHHALKVVYNMSA